MLLYKTYINKVLYNSNSCIEYTLAFTEIHMDCIEPAVYTSQLAYLL